MVLLAALGLVALGALTGSSAAETPEGAQLVDNFNDGLDEEDWEEVSPGNVNDDCGANSAPTALKFGSTKTRFATTAPVDATEAQTVAFAVTFGSGPHFPCKDDGADRDVDLQYSTDGENWTNIATYDDDTYKSWTHNVEFVPEEASTESTQFRWIQEGPDDIGRQQWALDDVWIASNLTAPTELTGQGTQPWGTAEISWQEPESPGNEPIQGYHLYRGETAEVLERVATVGPEERSYTDEGLDPGRPYVYEVTAFNEIREGPAAGPIEVQTLGPTIIRDAFDDALVDPFTWPETSGAAQRGSCGSTSGSSALHFAGGSRRATTLPLNVTEGGVASFQLRIGGPQSTLTEPACEDADRGEGLVLSYESGDGNWTRLQSFGPEAYHGFRRVVQPLPEDAQTTHTRLRIEQPAFSQNSDHWAIDDALIGSVPSAPRDASAERVDEGTRVSWQAPVTDGGLPIQAYEVYRQTPEGDRELVASVGPDAREVFVAASDVGRTEAYEVVAENRAGDGVPSEPDTVEGSRAPNLRLAGGPSQALAVYDDRDDDGEVDPGETWLGVENGTVHVESPRIGARVVSEDQLAGQDPLAGDVHRCTPADLVCVGPFTIPGLELAVTGADARVATGAQASLTSDPGTEAVGPFEANVPVPGIGSIPVTVCASGCPVPNNPATVSGSSLGLGGQSAGIQAPAVSIGG